MVTNQYHVYIYIYMLAAYRDAKHQNMEILEGTTDINDGWLIIKMMDCDNPPVESG